MMNTPIFQFSPLLGGGGGNARAATNAANNTTISHAPPPPPPPQQPPRVLNDLPATSVCRSSNSNAAVDVGGGSRRREAKEKYSASRQRTPPRRWDDESEDDDDDVEMEEKGRKKAKSDASDKSEVDEKTGAMAIQQSRPRRRSVSRSPARTFAPRRRVVHAVSPISQRATVRPKRLQTARRLGLGGPATVRPYVITNNNVCGVPRKSRYDEEDDQEDEDENVASKNSPVAGSERRRAARNKTGLVTRVYRGLSYVARSRLLQTLVVSSVVAQFGINPFSMIYNTLGYIHSSAQLIVTAGELVQYPVAWYQGAREKIGSFGSNLVSATRAFSDNLFADASERVVNMTDGTGVTFYDSISKAAKPSVVVAATTQATVM